MCPPANESLSFALILIRVCSKFSILTFFLSEKNVKISKPKNNLHHKQSAVKHKKYTANKNILFDECEMFTSDETEMPLSNASNDHEVKEGLNEVIRNLKPERLPNESFSSKSVWTPEGPSRKSVRLAVVDMNWSERALEARALAEAEKELMKIESRKRKPPKLKDNVNKVKDKKHNDNVNKVKDEKHDIKMLSEYEKMVQKNRDEKIAFLQSLKMDEAKQSLNEAMRNLKPKRKYTKRSENVSTSQGPPRKSVRLAEVDFNWSEKALQARARAEAEKELEKANYLKKLSTILTFEEAITEENVYTDFVCDFDDLDFKAPKPFTDYVSCFANMKMDKSKIAKVVHGEITAMALHPMKEKVIVSAGSSFGAISFWLGTSDSVPYVFAPHLSKVSCMKFNSDFLNQIISCSSDGTMRCGDMEKRIFNEVFNTSEETSCNYFDFISPTTTLVCHRNGNVSLVDVRTCRKSAEKSHKCHESSIRTVSVHPVNKSYFISADSRGFLSLWDLRNLQKEPVIEVFHKSVTSAFFSPVTGNYILPTAPLQNSLCLYDCSKLGSTVSLHRKVWHNFNSGRGKIFKATWLPNTDDAFVIGSMEYPRRIKVFNNQMDNIYNFQDKCLDCILPINVFHPSLPLLAGGNSSGKVYIFS